MHGQTVTILPARTLFLRKQLLGASRPPAGKAGLFTVIDALGYVQIDTISVIERSHHIVLFTRCPGYRHSFLHDLLSRDRTIFEYWAHMASYVPMKDYRYYLRRMREPPPAGSWMDTWLKSNKALMRKVQRRIEKEGALSARDFADVKGRKRGSWWDWKPAKTALEVLFWRGELMIKERRNFQRVYDLTERVLPPGVNTTLPDKDEETRFFVKRSLQALGIAALQDMQNYIRMRENPGPLINDMVSSDEICTVSIRGITRPFYVDAVDLEFLQSKRMRSGNRVYLLSPFDNAIILRDRTKTLFGFDYALECYKPKAQRKYGYFSLPILWRTDLIGRTDLKADRKAEKLIIRNLHLEKENLPLETFLPRFLAALRDFACFHRARSISCERVFPARHTRTVRKGLTRLALDAD